MGTVDYMINKNGLIVKTLGSILREREGKRKGEKEGKRELDGQRGERGGERGERGREIHQKTFRKQLLSFWN